MTNRNHISMTKERSIFFCRQRGSAMIEFTIVGPIISLIGLAILQYGMLFFAKNQINHASFMAARAGAMAHADLTEIQEAYARALVPMYGGGQNTADLAASLAKANLDLATNSRVVILNPTKESFDDWNSPALQTQYNKGSKRVIPNSNQAYADQSIKPNSGQNIGDANLIKVRITYGFEPKIPLVATIIKLYLKWLDTKDDAFHTQLIDAGRIPVVVDATLQMQSDAIEGDTVSTPGIGNNGTPTDPGNPPVVSSPPPSCATMGCTTKNPPVDPGTGTDCTGSNCPCPKTGVPVSSTMADTMFDFDQSTLSSSGTAALDTFIGSATTANIMTLSIDGYTDPVGTPSHNATLSQSRADAVRNYLVNHGLPSSISITATGHGASNLVVPLVNCSGMSDSDKNTCLAPNRRVVLTYTAKK